MKMNEPQRHPIQRTTSHLMILLLILAAIFPLSQGSSSWLSALEESTPTSITCLVEQVETHYRDTTSSHRTSYSRVEQYCIPLNTEGEQNEPDEDEPASIQLLDFPSEILEQHASLIQQGQFVCEISHYLKATTTKQPNSPHQALIVTKQTRIRVIDQPPQKAEGALISSPSSRIPPPLPQDQVPRNPQRRAVDFTASTGRHTVAIIYVSTPDAKVQYSIAQVRNHVFNNPTGSLRSQLLACSHGAMEIVNAGIHSIQLDQPIASFTNEPEMRYATYDKMKAQGLISSKAQELADHVVFMFPSFVKLEDCFVHKSSTVNKWFSALQNEWALDLMTLMHVFGHNMGLENAGRDQNTQGDWTSNMGSANTYPQLSTPLKCFNAYEHHQLKWYDDNDRKLRYTTAPEELPTVAIAPFTQYSQLGPQDNSIVLLVVENYALQYNKAESFNVGTELYKDMITVSELRDGQTWTLTGLAPTEEYQLILPDNKRRNRKRHLQESETVRELTFKAGELQVDASGNEFIGVSAEVQTVVVGPTQAPVTQEPSSAPSSLPSASPSESPTAAPVTFAPSVAPSELSPAYISSPIAPSAFTPTAPVYFVPIEPTLAPAAPSSLPSDDPSSSPSSSPSDSPTESSDSPSFSPSNSPTTKASGVPSLSPSNAPTHSSDVPTLAPSVGPTDSPVTSLPSTTPSDTFSDIPSASPVNVLPNANPSNSPVEEAAATTMATTAEESTTEIVTEVASTPAGSVSTTFATTITLPTSTEPETTTFPTSPSNTSSASDSLLAEPVFMIFNETSDSWSSPFAIVLLSVIGALTLVVCIILPCLYCRIKKLENNSANPVKPSKDSTDENTVNDDLSRASHGFLDDTHLDAKDIETGTGASVLLNGPNHAAAIGSTKKDKKRHKLTKDNSSSSPSRKSRKDKHKKHKKRDRSSDHADTTQTSSSTSIDGDGIEVSLDSDSMGSEASQEISWERVAPSSSHASNGQKESRNISTGIPVPQEKKTEDSPTRIAAKPSALHPSANTKKTNSDRSLGLPPQRPVSRDDELPQVAIDMGFVRREKVALWNSSDGESAIDEIREDKSLCVSVCSSIYSAESFPSDDDESKNSLDDQERAEEEAKRKQPTLRVLGEGLGHMASSGHSRSSSIGSGIFYPDDAFPSDSDDDDEYFARQTQKMEFSHNEQRPHSTKWYGMSESAQKAADEHHFLMENSAEFGDDVEPAEDFLLPWKGVDKSITRR